MSAKLKVMLLGTTVKTSKVSHVQVGLFIDDKDIVNVTCYKYLGVHIHVNLKWKEQMNNIICKVCALCRSCCYLFPEAHLSSILLKS